MTVIILYHNLDTGNTSIASFDPGVAEVSCPMGEKMIQVIFQTGNSTTGSSVMLNNTVVQICMRDPANRGAGYVMAPVTLTQGATAAAGFIGAINTYTYPATKLLNQVKGNSSPELPEYTLSASIVLLANDGSPADEQNPFDFILVDNNFRPSTPPPPIIETWSSPAQLQAAIAQAAAAVKTGDAPAFSGLTVNGTANLDGTINLNGPLNIAGTQPLQVGGTSYPNSILTTDVNSRAIAVSLSAGQALRRNAANSAYEGFNPFTGDGSGLTNLQASAIVGMIPLANLPAAVAGSLHYKGTWDANANNPPLESGGGSELGGYYVVGTSGATLIDGVNLWTAGDWLVFDGTKWDKLDGAANPVSGIIVNGTTETGLVTIPAGGDPTIPAMRKLGTDQYSAAAGNDGRFPASITGLRFGQGAGGQDRVSVFGSDLGSFHPVIWTGSSGVAPFYNGTSIAFGPSGNSSLSVAEWTSANNSGNGYPARRVSDLAATFGVYLVSSGSNSTPGQVQTLNPPALLATITFDTAYPSSPDAPYSISPLTVNGTTTFAGQPGTVKITPRYVLNSDLSIPNYQVSPQQIKELVFARVWTGTTLKIYLLTYVTTGNAGGTSNPAPLCICVDCEIILGS